MRLPSRAGWEAWFYRKRDFPWNIVPKLSAKPSLLVRMQAAVRMQAPSNEWDAARGSGRKFLSRHARATDAEQMRFCLKSHNSKLLKTKKAVSSYYAKSMLTCRAL